MLGCALIGMGETEKSLSFFDAALMIDEKHIISYIQKGILQKLFRLIITKIKKN